VNQIRESRYPYCTDNETLMYTTIYQPATQIAARFQTKLCWSCLLHITTLFYNQTSAWSPNCLLCHLEDRILDKNTIIPDLPRERARATSYSEYWESQRCCEMSHRTFSVVKSPKNRPQNILQYDIGSRCHHVILKIKFCISIEASLMFLLIIKRTVCFKWIFCWTATLNKETERDIPNTSQNLPRVENARDVNSNSVGMTNSGSATNNDKLCRDDHGLDELRTEDLIRPQIKIRSDLVDKTANSVDTKALTDARSSSVDRSAISVGTNGDYSVVSIFNVHADAWNEK